MRHLEYQADSFPQVAVLEPSPLPMPGTPETTPSTPKTLPRHAVQRGIFDTPDQADHSHPDVAVPSAENSHTTPPVQTSSQFLRFNPSPTSTAVLSRLAKIHDHPVSPSSTGHSWDPSPIDGPVEGHTAGRWPLGNKAVNGEAAAATAPKTG
ncbi:hypothetical protein BD324DRAFT_412871 [Kockovaella imperatae]|uniref:Uncharacterized protein n=1 Tax=Kockovaella imperatae TaxID=4999 RepID=A0A1Y1UIV5_9TREE|nr:hypothetical protein BD324DRAFT_412871 [Kockovaella imperatae]ORX37988.1 hypothetical protein BD324DRAFT_412871 [Kockovaella imperatae]